MLKNVFYFNSVHFVMFILCNIIVSANLRQQNHHESFEESLTLQPFQDGHILAHFAFEMTTMLHTSSYTPSFALFPRVLYELVSSIGVDSLHVSLGSGRWYRAMWGRAPPFLNTASGAQLSATFQNLKRPNSQWSSLQSLLGGMLCASLVQMDEKHTAYPIISADFFGHNNVTNTQLHYGILPREIVCTENLAPFVKLLPCSTKAGLAKLLNRITLFDSTFHSMGMRLRTTQDSRLLATLTITSVFDPLYLHQNAAWSLDSLFDQSTASACALASSSIITLQSTSRGVHHNSSYEQISTNQLAFDLISHPYTKLSYEPLPPVFKPQTQSLNIHRYVSGRGLHYGGICLRLNNTKINEIQRIVYHEFTAWYIRIFFHTLQFTLYTSTDSRSLSTEDFSRMRFKPAKFRISCNEIEFDFLLPLSSTLVMFYEFEKVFLPINEFPPDVARGFDVAPGMVTIIDEDNEHVETVFTEPLLIILPGPDMSMPFNVIAFTSTLLAFVFGTMFNVLYRHPNELSQRLKSSNLMRFIRMINAIRVRIRTKILSQFVSTNIREKEEISDE